MNGLDKLDRERQQGYDLFKKVKIFFENFLFYFPNLVGKLEIKRKFKKFLVFLIFLVD